MKSLRIFILVLLTVLLPLRGAVAATMLCPGGAGTGSAAVTTGHAHHDMDSAQGMNAQGAALHDHSHGHASGDPSSDTHASTCQFGAGGCCVTPLAFAPPSVQGPLLAASAAFPALTARVAVHYPDGQDRPPRTI